MVPQCQSRLCKKCETPHHTLLCPVPDEKPPKKDNSPPKTEDASCTYQVHTAVRATNLLATAMILVKDKRGIWVPGRALLDSGSQVTFITEAFRQRLGLPLMKNECNIQTMNGVSEMANSTTMEIKSRINNYSKVLNAVVQQRILDVIPRTSFEIREWKLPKNIQLADPRFFESATVDMLLSVEVTSAIQQVGCIKLSENLPLLQNTLLGWVVSGRLNENSGGCLMVNTTMEAPTEIDISKFWEVEDVGGPNLTEMSKKEKEIEENFLKSIVHRNDGYYEVHIPYKQNVLELGKSIEMARCRYEALQRRLTKLPPDASELYHEFFNEYETLGHMTVVPKHEYSKITNMIPHHPVIRMDKVTTKVRGVFDASASTSNGLSFNDIQDNGPTLQDELFDILIRFRTHKVILIADIEKMYRQVMVSKTDTYAQCIFWKDQIYRLLTVTYGTKSAPYLAVRALRYCAEQNQNLYPEASKVTLKDFYMDDLLTGTDDESQAKQLVHDLNSMLSNCNMTLRKWVSNYPEVLSDIPESELATHFAVDDDMIVKTLGITYHPREDIWKINVDIDTERRITKRTIQSDVARIYDLLGLVGPVIFKLKILLQKLWLLHLHWDEALPQDIYTEYDSLRANLHLLNGISFPRSIRADYDSPVFEIHGFCDASDDGYAATVYLRVVYPDGSGKLILICSKNKVAPLKRLTLARLELCGVELLSLLILRVYNALNLPIKRVICWTDSTIVLQWLKRESRLFLVFVANRVTRIQSNKLINEWRHIPGKLNPADMLSRGKTPAEILNEDTLKFWQHGPSFLSESPEKWPQSSYKLEEITKLPEIRKKKLDAETHAAICGGVLESNVDLVTLLNPKFHHSAQSMIRIFSHVFRFVQNCRKKNVGVPLEGGSNLLVKAIQYQAFQKEYQLIENKISLRGPLRYLNPFIDETGLIRVGGRLANANLPYKVKFPIILPKNNVFTKAILRHLHFKHLHCGPTALLATVRQQYWPINGRRMSSFVVQHCIICFTNKPTNTPQLMGALPETNVQLGERPFINVCLDFLCGLTIHHKGRGSRTSKGYVCIIICKATHAAHLEVVEELTTNAFIAALRRFIGRRGLCKFIRCDNGKNFVGACNAFDCFFDQLLKEEDTVKQSLAAEKIEFEFSPAHSPHHNGLAEAGVKSFKKHFYRVAGEASLTYEELNTLTIQIEAALNSRPLLPLSEDPNDFEALTPGHFIIGAPLNSFPEPVLTSPPSMLKRYERLRQLLQHFWQRWSSEYITNLQPRHRWCHTQNNLRLGQLVMIHQDHTRPFRWPLGRITKLSPGRDNVVRVATIKTRQGEIDRAITKIYPLPLPMAPADSQPAASASLET